MKPKTYTGIGSRQTPVEVCATMWQLAMKLAQEDWVVRSGCAPGADWAFEHGALETGLPDRVELFLPWAGFEGKYVEHVGPFGLTKPTFAAMEIAKRFHPAWDRLTRGAQLLHARNVHQIVGADVSEPQLSAFVVCWTHAGRREGGTGQALRIADHYDVPIFDLALPTDAARIADWLDPTTGIV